MSILPQFQWFLRKTSLLLIGLAGISPLYSETLTVPATQDTTLQSVFPDNNFGAHEFLNIGHTGMDLPTRGLIRFDLVGKIPLGAEINSVALKVNVDFIPFGGKPAEFALHRVLESWGEGTKKGNAGEAATASEATWKMRSHSSSRWSGDGANPGGSSATAASAIAAIAGVGNSTFSSNVSLVDDIKFWMANPDKNFGWLLKDQSESVVLTAKRFSARESGANGPTLIIDFSLPVENELPRVSLIAPANGAVFTAAESITLIAEAEDADGTISKVEFFEGENLLGSVSEAPYTISIQLPPRSYSVTAKATDNSGATATSRAAAITITKAGQTISLEPLPDRTLGDPPFLLEATASSDLPVTFSMVSGPATISENTLTLSGGGMITVRAEQGGNETFNSAPPIERSFKVLLILTTSSSPGGLVTRDPDSLKYILGTRVVLTAVPNSGFVFLSWTGEASTENPLAITMDSSKSISANFRETVAPAITILSPTDNQILSGTLPISATITFEVELQNVTAQVEEKQTALLSSSGNPSQWNGAIDLAGLPPGTHILKITATDRSGKFGSQQVDFIIPKSDQRITFAELNEKVTDDPPFGLEATASSGLPVSFTVVSGPATISENSLTLSGAGLVTIRASQAGDQNFNPAEAVDRSFNVLAPLQTTSTVGGSITREPDSAAYLLKTNVKLTAIANAGFSFVSWTGDAASAENPLTITMDRPKTLTANFRDSDEPKITITSPAQTTTTSEDLSISGTIGDNVGVVSAFWQQEVQAQTPLTLAEGVFTIGNLVLKRGENRFHFRASDAAGNEGTAELVVTFAPPVPLSFDKDGTGRMQDGFRLRLQGRAGDKYLIEKSGNLKDWIEAGNVTNENGTVDFLDPEFSDPMRFYRAQHSN